MGVRTELRRLRLSIKAHRMWWDRSQVGVLSRFVSRASSVKFSILPLSSALHLVLLSPPSRYSMGSKRCATLVCSRSLPSSLTAHFRGIVFCEVGALSVPSASPSLLWLKRDSSKSVRTLLA